MTTTTINKFCLINQLQLPEVIFDIIKSYAFHSIDKITAKNKVKKDKIISLITNGIFLGEDIDNGGVHWTKEIYCLELGNNNKLIRTISILQLQSINCRVCGNYWGWDNISQIRCKCHENEEVYI